MANNRIQVKRTNTAGRTANVTNSGNTQYIDAGEFALNMADGILYSSNGSALIEVGVNNTNSNITSTLTVGNSTVNTAINSTSFGLGNSSIRLSANSSGIGSGDTLTIFSKLKTHTGYFLNNGTNGWALPFGSFNSATSTTGGFTNSTIFALTANGGYGWTSANVGSSQATPVTDTAIFKSSPGVVYVSNGTVGNYGNLVVNSLLSSSINIENDKRINFKTVNTAASAHFVQQNDDNFVFYTTNTAYGQRPVWSIFANSISSAFDIVVPLKISSALIANSSNGTAGQVLTSSGTGAYWSSAAGGGGTGTVTSVDTGNGMTGGPITTTGTVSVLANTGIVANATGVFVNSAYIGTLTANDATNLNGQPASYYTNATNISSGTLPYAQIPANVINTTAAFTRTGITTFSANVVLGSSGVSSNGSFGIAGHVLHSNGSATYWAADDNSGGTVTSVGSGNGLTGGPITTTGSLSVLANSGIISNATGVYVNTTYIATLTANNAAYLGGTIASGYQTTAGLASNVATLIANNAYYFAGYTWESPAILGGTTANGGSFTYANVSGQVNTATLYATTSANIASVVQANSTGVYVAAGANAISLTNATSNWIYWNSVGTAAPAFTTRSAGTKLILYPAIDASAVDYALGINAGTLWSSIPGNDAGQFFKWYGGTTEVASLSGTGQMAILGTINAASYTVGTAFTANSTVVNAVSYYAGSLLIANSTVSNATHLGGQLPAYYTNATNITTGTLPYAQIPANVINTTAAFTRTGITTFSANVVLGSSGLSSNGSFGTAGQVLHSNGTATYWAADDNSGGTVTSVASGNGLTGGPITSTGTLAVGVGNGISVSSTEVSVRANNGLTSNSTGVYVVPGNGLITANNSGVHVGAGNGISVNTTAVSVIAGNGMIESNSSGVHVGKGNGISINSTAVSVLANNGLSSNATGVFVVPGNGLIAANSTGVHVGAGNGISVNTTAVSVIAGNGLITANSTGVHVGAGNGISVNTTAVSIFANSGLTANASGLFVVPGTGISVNSTAVAVNATYIATITANNAEFLSGVAAASYVQNTDSRTLSGNLVFTGANVSFQSAALGGTATNFVNNYTITTNVGNESFLKFYHYRHTTGSDWTGASTRLQQRIDSTDMAYLEFNPSGFAQGVGVYGATGRGLVVNQNGQTTFGNTVILGSVGVSSNGSLGTAGQVLHSNGTATYWAADDSGGTGTVTSVATGNGMTGGPITTTGTVSILANTGIVANTTGVFVNSAYIGTLTANNTSFVGSTSAANVVSNTQLSSNLANYQTTAGLSANVATLTSNNSTNFGGQLPAFYTNATNITTGTLPYAQIPANVINTTAAFTRTGITTFSANVVLGSSGVSSNGSFGTAGHVLHSNGTATYWAVDDQGVTSVATGNGLTGGTITATGTISVIANNGLSANVTGVYVVPGNGLVASNSTGVHVGAGSGVTVNSTATAVLANTGIVANATGVFVNSAYIATIAANSATYANASISNTFTVGTASYFVANGNVGIGNSAPTHKLSVNGTTFLQANVTLNAALIANGNSGTAGQVLSSNGIATYWATVASGGGVYMKGGTATIGTLASEGQNIFRVNANTLNTNTTIASGENAQATGPITVVDGVTLTIATNGRVSIV